MFKFLGTAYDRTDVMAEVFQSRLFYDKKNKTTKTFRDLPNLPRLVINATNFTFGTSHFTFTNDSFDNLNSDLANLPVGRAVATSAAFPGLLRNATLGAFKKGTGEVVRYHHLFDGGPSDNLGIESLLSIYDTEISKYGKEFTQGCLIIMVDAFTPFFQRDQEQRPDTRRFHDFIILGVDVSNVINSSTIFLQTKRRKMLDQLGFDLAHLDDAEQRNEPIGLLKELKIEEVPLDPETTYKKRKLVQQRRRNCRVWHVALTQFRTIFGRSHYNEQLQKRYEPMFLERMKISNKEYSFKNFSDDVTDIPTRFKITKEQLENLYTAAYLLVNERQTKQKLCEWFQSITKEKCKA